MCKYGKQKEEKKDNDGGKVREGNNPGMIIKPKCFKLFMRRYEKRYTYSGQGTGNELTSG